MMHYDVEVYMEGVVRDRKDGYSLGDASLSALIKTPASDSGGGHPWACSLIWGTILNIWLRSNSCLARPADSVGSRLGVRS